MTDISWPRLEAALDKLLDLPAADRPAALREVAGGDAAFQNEVRMLLAHAERDETWLDRPAVLTLDERSPPVSRRLDSGQRVGTYRIVEFLGQGGMGEVYRAERADGQFEQQVALKLIRGDAIAHVERFLAERQILARLDHPGIARILNGGLFEGQPYMVMELVCGQTITQWCRARKSTLEERLRLFVDVCDAVACAHYNLIVHRDLKPANVLVTDEGKVKLLDFGIAKPIAAEETGFAPLTPSHAAPEQLTGGPISTATDVYALGMLLFELLAGEPPWALSEMPMAIAIRTVLEETPPPPSRSPAPPVPPRALAGDLDAIVAKTLRKESAQRYETVDALKQDILRSMTGQPVSARAGSRLYVAGRFARRHRLPIAAASLVALALMAGFIGATWEYLRADHEAARAETIKNFVISLYAGNDPGFPKDKLRRDVTAETLLDLGVDRIEREFAGDPDLEIELYDLTGGLYDSLNDPDRAARMHEMALGVARKAFGDAHSLVLSAQLQEAWFAMGAGDQDKARRILDTLDRVLRESGQDKTAYRAFWWVNKAQLLGMQTNGTAAQRDALDHALATYERYAPKDPNYVAALQNAGIVRIYAGDYAEAADLYQKALLLWHRLPEGERTDRDLVYVLTNRAGALLKLGRLDEAKASYEQAAEMAMSVSGQSDPYWTSLSRIADLLLQQGQRDEAMARYDDLLKRLPAVPSASGTAEAILMRYADGLTAIGRPADAIAVLDRIRAGEEREAPRPRETRRLDYSLGLAYARAGRTAEARALLSRAMEEYAADPKSLEMCDLRGRWGWFLLSQGETEAASAAFDAVIRDEADMAALSISPSLAWAGRARLALARGDAAAAKTAIARAFEAYGTVKALHDVRTRTTLLLVRSAVSRSGGDRAGARRDAAEALYDASRLDAPGSPAIREAREALAASS